MSKGETNRSKRTKRPLALVADLLDGREHDAQSLAARLGIKPAQAGRLLKAALDLLPVVKATVQRPLKIKMEPGFLPAPSYPTAVAACFGSSLWPLFEGSGYATGIRNATREVFGRTKRHAVFRDIERKFWFLRRGGEVALVDRSELLDDILEAVLHSQVVVLEYTRFGGASEHARVEPLSILIHDHQLYVVGRGAERKLHPYRFARIKSVTVLDDTFEYPARSAYDPERVFARSFGIFIDGPAEDVVLKLHKKWATYTQSHRWHPSQEVEPASGHVIVRMHVSVCPELIAWILGFGEDAEVLEPTGLRMTIAQRAEALGRVYAQRAAPGLRKAAKTTRTASVATQRGR